MVNVTKNDSFNPNNNSHLQLRPQPSLLDGTYCKMLLDSGTTRIFLSELSS